MHKFDITRYRKINTVIQPGNSIQPEAGHHAKGKGMDTNKIRAITTEI